MIIEYRTNTDNSLKEAGKGPTTIHIRNMKLREEDLTMARQIKYIEGKFRKSGTTFFTQQQTNGRTMETTHKTPLEEVIIA